MTTVIHFIDVGQGNMVLIEASAGTPLHAFICSHRDADHMRGVKKLHRYFPVRRIWDSDYPGTTTNSPEYREYMDLRRQVGARVIKKKTRDDFGKTRLRYMSAQDERLPDNANAQGIVIDDVTINSLPLDPRKKI